MKSWLKFVFFYKKIQNYTFRKRKDKKKGLALTQSPYRSLFTSTRLTTHPLRQLRCYLSQVRGFHWMPYLIKLEAFIGCRLLLFKGKWLVVPKVIRGLRFTASLFKRSILPPLKRSPHLAIKGGFFGFYVYAKRVKEQEIIALRL